MSVLPEMDKCVYTKYYCEENVWQLCKHIEGLNNGELLSNCYAVFISNEDKTVPVWKQKSSNREDTMVIWDYHVILFFINEGLVYDLDTLLSFPCMIGKYVLEALKCELDVKPRFRQFLRLVPAMQFLKTFSSDRSHMLTDDRTWISAPPDYPTITTSETANNLETFINMKEDLNSKIYGKVYSVVDFVKEFL